MKFIVSMILICLCNAAVAGGLLWKCETERGSTFTDIYDISKIKSKKCKVHSISDGKRWMIINADIDYVLELDLESISSGNDEKLWTRNVYFKPQITNSVPPAIYNYDLVESQFNCNNFYIKGLRILKYNNSGSVVENVDMKNSDWLEPVPQTTGEAMLVIACAIIDHKKSKK